LTPDQVKFGAPGLGSPPDGVSDPTGSSKRLRRRGRTGSDDEVGEKRREQAWLT
jgi:hypothetical protein